MSSVLAFAAEAILKKLLEKTSEALGASAGHALTSKRAHRKLLEEHLRQTTLRLSRLVAYRPSPQQIEEVYVQPVVMDETLSLADIEPKLYEFLEQFISKIRQEGPSKLSVTSILDQTPPPVRQLISNIKTFSADQLAATEGNFIILGEAGAGKSSLLQFVCYKRILDKQSRLPIFIESLDLLDRSVTDILRETTSRFGFDSSLLLKLGGSLSIYVDGLDELEPTKYYTICRELSDLVNLYPQIVVCAAMRSSA